MGHVKEEKPIYNKLFNNKCKMRYKLTAARKKKDNYKTKIFKRKTKKISSDCKNNIFKIIEIISNF